MINEYLTTLAFKALLPSDSVVDIFVSELNGFSQQALIIKRFDRSVNGRIHFEEFNQMLGKKSDDKYNGSYRDMAKFIDSTNNCLPSECYRLYLRIIAGLLLGNTDMHFKNFAMIQTQTGYRLSPSYDQVAAAIYHYKTVALAVSSSSNFMLGKLKPGNIIKLGQEYSLSADAINMAVLQLEKKINAAENAVAEACLGSTAFKNKIITMMRKRWNGTFALIGQALSKRR